MSVLGRAQSNSMTIDEAELAWRPWLYMTIPDDPEWLAVRLPAHRYCETHVRGHQSCVDEAARLLAAMKEDS